MKRVGLIGFGFIASQVYERIAADPSLGMEVAFVHNRSPHRLAAVPAELRIGDPGEMLERGADLVVEMAHPDYTRHWGERILRSADYLPVSVSALADPALLQRLSDTALACGTRLFIPHGALIGTDNLVEWREMWSTVEITFVKDPRHIDFSESGIDPSTIAGETLVYEGSVQGIAALFPRNVNTMVTCALATVGVERCRARLVAVPGSPTATLALKAHGHDGSELTIRRVQPMAGVSGTEMLASTLGSIARACQASAPLQFV